MPAIRENIRTFFNGKEPNCSINPDEAVAMGAAIQGYIISHRDDPFSESVTLLDIVPLSFGVETIGGVMNVLIPRNSIIPISRKRKYTTDDDFMTSVNIKIYEGERQMTKDNFFVGEFQLANLESAPRGIVKIEVKFSIDANGIIRVTAEDLDNPENKNGITITGNKGRLSKEKINQLLEEAKESELKDKIEKRKKQLYYEVDDICSNILININNDEFKLSESDKENIIKHIDEICEWLSNSNYYDKTEDEYKDILKLINNKYGTLRLKYSKEKIILQAQEEKVNMTTIYGDDDDDAKLNNANNTFENIENDDLGISEFADDEKMELKEIRTNLMNLCDQVYHILTSNSICLDNEHKKELQDFIDDTLIWIHIQPKINKIDFMAKLNEVNQICNQIAEEYNKNNKELFETNAIKKSIQSEHDELENLCYALKSSLSENYFNLDKTNINILDDKIDNTLKWLLDIDTKTIVLQNENEFSEKINEINELCNTLYKSMTSNIIIPNNNNLTNMSS